MRIAQAPQAQKGVSTLMHIGDSGDGLGGMNDPTSELMLKGVFGLALASFAGLMLEKPSMYKVAGWAAAGLFLARDIRSR